MIGIIVAGLVFSNDDNVTALRRWDLRRLFVRHADQLISRSQVWYMVLPSRYQYSFNWSIAIDTLMMNEGGNECDDSKMIERGNTY